jgi:hypothetical protein
MRYIVPAVLLIVALIHVLPLAGVLGAAKLSSLYGITVQDPNLEILMRHRTVLCWRWARPFTFEVMSGLESSMTAAVHLG